MIASFKLNEYNYVANIQEAYYDEKSKHLVLITSCSMFSTNMDKLTAMYYLNRLKNYNESHSCVDFDDCIFTAVYHS